MNKIIYLSFLIVLIQACSPSPEASYKGGYNDGYKQGYNLICKLGRLPAEGDWDNKDYIRGYSAGQRDGASKASYAVSANNCKTTGAYTR